MADQATFISPEVFADLQNRIDEDAEAKEQIREILKGLERQERGVLSLLSKVHNTRTAELTPILEAATTAIKEEVESIKKLGQVASKYPYYKYNGLWTKDVQNVIFAILLCGWLGGLNVEGKENKEGTLLSIEEVGQFVGVPINLRTRDAFHLTLEEYLMALITLIEELSRLATNSVTLGDYARPLQISKFVNELHAGFQILNLKNDSLRRRSDGIKYMVKNVESVVYDLSLRGLVPK